MDAIVLLKQQGLNCESFSYWGFNHGLKIQLNKALVIFKVP